MKKLTPKKLRKVVPPPAVKKLASKSKKTKLSKSDPDYFKKIGLISAKKRKLTSADYSAMAAKSHPRKEYKGGRPKNEPSE